MSELPESWAAIALSDAVINITITDKKIPQKEYLSEGAYPVFDQGQDYIGGYSDNKGKLVDCELPVLVFGDHTRVVKFVNQPFAPGADGIKVLQPQHFFNARLLEYFTRYIATHLTNHGYARHYQHLVKSIIPFPPVNEQHRIVAKIDELFSELDKGIENLKTARAQLKVYRQALLKHAFEGKLSAQWRAENSDKLETAETLQKRIQQERAQRHRQQLADWEAACKQGSKPKAPKPLPPLTAEELAELPELPEGWGWMKLGDFISSIDAGKSFKCDEREPRANEIGVAKVSAVTWGEYDESESKTCTDTSKENEAYLIRSGDFILSRANTIDLVGACVIARKVTKKIMLSDKTLRIVFDGFQQEYFLQYLSSRIGRKQIMLLSTGNQESMRNIGQDRIRSIAVPICSGIEAESVMEALASRLSEVDQLELTITTSLQQAEALRQSILKKAFSGQLVSQDANDEPASVLLSRIQAERAAQPAMAKPRKPQKAQPAPVQMNVIPFPVKLANISSTDLHAGILARAYQHHEHTPKYLANFGHVKAEKIVHLVEAHLGIDLGREPVKAAAGPNDFSRLINAESRARKMNWFDVRKQKKDGAYVFTKRDKFDALLLKTRNALGERAGEVDILINKLLPLNRRQAEIVATLYAAWNNLLLVGHTPSDEDIVCEARENWHDSKLKIERDKFFRGLKWMREQGLVPAGKGRHVGAKEARSTVSKKKPVASVARKTKRKGKQA